jgi:hypothetical protein
MVASAILTRWVGMGIARRQAIFPAAINRSHPVGATGRQLGMSVVLPHHLGSLSRLRQPGEVAVDICLGWQEMPLVAPPPLDAQDGAAEGESGAAPSTYDPFAQPAAGAEMSTSDGTYDPFSQPQQQSSSSSCEPPSSTATFPLPTPVEQPTAAPPPSAPPVVATESAVAPGSSSSSGPGTAAANGCVCPMVLIQKDPANEAQYLRCHLAVSPACQLSTADRARAIPESGRDAQQLGGWPLAAPVAHMRVRLTSGCAVRFRRRPARLESFNHLSSR